ncbi:nuclear transport factor 2 family protein [Rhodococcus opacus]|uniref:SnoaL-like domain-containing protein n=1 Tax=Rhodococcus opacus TaxID=37919 RepID=A0A076EX16_RHOOP|nr:nuclear transport factor 2 family protein [Rhodococcus opacus]AII10540.1 hypothetical protein EP51_40510 [Rhodococcus opacus]
MYPHVDTSDSLAVAELIAKQEIYEVLCRYCRGIDRLDLELVRSCYHPDARDHHVSFDGTRDEFIDWVDAELRQMDGTMHSIANHLVELDGDRARCETYVNTYSWSATSTRPAHNSLTGTRYVDTFELRAGVWRIAERWAVRSWIRTDSDGVVQAGSGPGPAARRDRGDLVYRPITRS